MSEENKIATIVSLTKWRKEVGVSRTWAWRMRKQGVLNCVIIAGRPYLTAHAIADFVARAEAGELAHLAMILKDLPKPE